MMKRRSPHSPFPEGLEKLSSQKAKPFSRELLDAIDESPEFHDPYSELNLFLSKKIKQQMCHCSNPKKWTSELQDQLLNRITPEFQQKFPKYRLGVSALKKSWEKVNYFASQIQGEREALTQDGKLNLTYFIKENLKSCNKLQNTCHLHPYHYAHQLAVKMSECIAVVDGIRPKLDQLTRTIWSLQRHLIPKLAPEHFKSPYDEYESIDKLIVQTILEITAKHPEISQAELAFHAQKRLVQVRSVAECYTENQIRKMLSALYADLCHYPSERMERTLERIPYPIAKCLKSQLATIVIDSPHLSSQQVTEEAFIFFHKAHKATQDFEEDEIERKIQNWTIQGDMFLRWIRLNHSSALFQIIDSIWDERCPTDFFAFVSDVRENFLEEFPSLLSFSKEIELRIWIYLKYIWYTKGCENIATYDRFIQWQKHLLRPQKLSPQETIGKVEELCKKMLPLLPFNRARAQTILVTEKQDESHEDHG